MSLETSIDVGSLVCKSLRREIPINKEYDRLTVVRYLGHEKTNIIVLCRCTCGTEKPIRLRSLDTGNTASCGCLRRKHGEGSRNKQSAEFKIWLNMKRRCHDNTNPGYKNYGGRGILVCPQWHEYRCFRDYLDKTIGRKPGAGYSLDRVDNNRGYEPNNVRWASRREQSNNSRRVHRLTLNGVSASLAEWSRRLGIPYATIKWRLYHGRSVKEVLRVC